MNYTVRFATGSKGVSVDSYDAAVAAVRAAYPDAYIGPPGEFRDAWPTWIASRLCWETLDESRDDDDGEYACAAIFTAR